MTTFAPIENRLAKSRLSDSAEPNACSKRRKQTMLTRRAGGCEQQAGVGKKAKERRRNGETRPPGVPAGKRSGSPRLRRSVSHAAIVIPNEPQTSWIGSRGLRFFRPWSPWFLSSETRPTAGEPRRNGGREPSSNRVSFAPSADPRLPTPSRRSGAPPRRGASRTPDCPSPRTSAHRPSARTTCRSARSTPGGRSAAHPGTSPMSTRRGR